LKKSTTDPVHLAVLRHDIEELSVAIRNGSDVNALDREGRTALFYTAKDGEMEMTSELLRGGVNPNIQDKRLETALHFAARYYQLKIAQRLLESGARVDVQDIFGNTPLGRAVFDSRGRGGMISLLLSHGADKTLPNKHGVSPEKLANTIANYNVRRFLE